MPAHSHHPGERARLSVEPHFGHPMESPIDQLDHNMPSKCSQLAARRCGLAKRGLRPASAPSEAVLASEAGPPGAIERGAAQERRPWTGACPPSSTQSSGAGLPRAGPLAPSAGRQRRAGPGSFAYTPLAGLSTALRPVPGSRIVVLTPRRLSGGSSRSGGGRRPDLRFRRCRAPGDGSDAGPSGPHGRCSGTTSGASHLRPRNPRAAGRPGDPRWRRLSGHKRWQ